MSHLFKAVFNRVDPSPQMRRSWVRGDFLSTILAIGAFLIGIMLTASCSGENRQKTGNVSVHSLSASLSSSESYEALRAIRQLGVYTYSDVTVPPERGSAGSFAVQMRKLATERLRAAGLDVVRSGDSADALLSINVYAVCDGDDQPCGYHVSVELRQRVYTGKNSDLKVAATTWQNSYTRGIRRSSIDCCLADQLVVYVETLLDGFINDYRRSGRK